MQRVFDSVLASSDMSLDRVLNAGLPTALVFYDRELPDDLRQSLDELAREYAGKVLMVMLARSDAPQALSRFAVHQFPTLVTVKDNLPIARQANVRSADLKPYIAHLIGEGPRPISRVKDSGSSVKPEAGGGPLEANESNFEREVLRSDRPVLIDFWASWCAPCRMVEPTVEKLAHEQSALKVVKVNVDENPNLASRYRAMSIPMMIIIKDGQEVDRWIGAQPESVIRNRVARWIH